ncbi:MAG: HAMP domain-containing histidine kinase, partial [Gemmatimonadetes bacterium]|nr:HAMP domain-containing histidine kinase [Gemmatimonadota bacterium]
KVDPDVLVRECTAAIQPLLQDGVEIKTDVDYEGTLMSDPDRLRRGLMNLLGNAVKFTQSGSVTATLRRDEGETVLSVADTGVGIAADELPHIFDEFRQVARKGSSAQEGTGLGLAIVKRSVELIGGRVSVDSVEGEGTMFTIRVRDLQPQGEAA